MRMEKRNIHFGEDAIGYICYSDTGIMAVQISRKSRGEVKDLAHLKHDYLAYFGRYEIDTDKQVVRHFVEGQLFPGGHPGVLERKYRFDGDLMLLSRWMGPIAKFCGSESDESPLPKAANNLDRRQG